MIINEAEFDEKFYLAQNPDVASAIKRLEVRSAYSHYQLFGEKERRPCRKILQRSPWEDGFRNSSARLYFYALIQNSDFATILMSENYEEILAYEIETKSPKFILDNFK